MDDFRKALPITLSFEGGYADHPDDPGGATMRGVTQATYDAHRASGGLEKRPVREITEGEVEGIYRVYWDEGHCSALTWPASACHFDACINHGPRNAAKILQRALGVKDDGLIGGMTFAAIRTRPPREVAEEMLWARLQFYEDIMLANKRLRSFALGWLSRINSLRKRIKE